MFLNTTATVANWDADGTECSLVRRAAGAGGRGCAARGARAGGRWGAHVDLSHTPIIN